MIMVTTTMLCSLSGSFKHRISLDLGNSLLDVSQLHRWRPAGSGSSELPRPVAGQVWLHVPLSLPQEPPPTSLRGLRLHCTLPSEDPNDCKHSHQSRRGPRFPGWLEVTSVKCPGRPSFVEHTNILIFWIEFFKMNFLYRLIFFPFEISVIIFKNLIPSIFKISNYTHCTYFDCNCRKVRI